MVRFYCDYCGEIVGAVAGIGVVRDHYACRRRIGCTPALVVELFNVGFLTCLACCHDWCSECFASEPRCDCTSTNRVIRRVHECLFLAIHQQ